MNTVFLLKFRHLLFFGTLCAKFKFSVQFSARSFDFLNTYSSKMKNFGTAKHVFQIMEPSSKRSRITDFFQKLPSNPAVSTPEYPAFLRRFRPIDALRRPRSRVRPCRSSPELQAVSTDEASTPPAADENNSAATNQRGTYKSYRETRPRTVRHF